MKKLIKELTIKYFQSNYCGSFSKYKEGDKWCKYRGAKIECQLCKELSRLKQGRKSR